jgi:hypothetical protein
VEGVLRLYVPSLTNHWSNVDQPQVHTLHIGAPGSADGDSQCGSHARAHVVSVAMPAQMWPADANVVQTPASKATAGTWETRAYPSLTTNVRVADPEGQKQKPMFKEAGALKREAARTALLSYATCIKH